MLHKDTPVLIKAGPDDDLPEGTFTAYASVFGNKDSYGDVVMPGAFTDDLKAWEESGNPIPLLFGHNMSDPDYNIGSVKAVEDDHGLLVTASLDLENPKAAQVYRMLKGRRINQMSFAYDVLDGGEAERTTADGEKERYYELRRLKTYEVSVVTIGANQETEVLSVKAMADALASGAKAGRVLSAKNESALRAARDSLDSVLASLGDADTAKGNSPNSNDGTASGTTPAKSDADDEGREVKSSVPDEEPKSIPSARLTAQLHIYALTGAERGSR